MKQLNLTKKERSTTIISPKFLDLVRGEVQGVTHGSLEIVIKGGHILGFRFHQWKPFRSRSQGLKEEK